MFQLKQKNLQSLNELNKMMDDINHLDSTFNTMQGDAEMIVKETKENYFSTLNNFEVYTILNNLIIFMFVIYV